MSNTSLCVKVNLKKYSLEAVRYAAYAVSDKAFVMVKGVTGSSVSVGLTPKCGKPAAGLKAGFLAELEDEKLREAVSDNNRELREFLVLKALTPEKKQEQAADSGLTAEQEKELEDLIAQVEGEIKREARGGKQEDPLGITKTWEDKYGGKKNRKK